MNIYEESELILNPDGSVYHLHLLPEDIANTIMTVGDQDRITDVTKYFDRIDVKKKHREFCTVTGWIGDKRLSCISTGIGTDNIDIILNELDALVNIDLKNRVNKEQKTSLNIVRIGTSGAIQPDIPIDSILVSEYAVGMEGLMLFYDCVKTNEEQEIENALSEYLKVNNALPLPLYVSKADEGLVDLFAPYAIKGFTQTNTGFYGPQGRVLRYALKQPKFNDIIANFKYKNWKITNYEMETAGIYGLGRLLGHRCCAVNAIVANRALRDFSDDPQKTIDKTIKMVVEQLIK